MNPIERFLANFEAESVRRDVSVEVNPGKVSGRPRGRWNTSIFGCYLKERDPRLNFVHRYPDRDLTQNYPVPEGISLVRDWLGKSSLAATLFTVDQRQQLLFNRHVEPPRLSTSSAETVENHLQHDREKHAPVAGRNISETSRRP